MPKRSNDEGFEIPHSRKVQFEHAGIGPVSSMEDFDKKLLQHQNKKLAQRLEQQNILEVKLKNQIEQLEKRQIIDDSILNVVNRYWNQLNEDISILLQRFDSEISDEIECKNESIATKSFLAQLSSCDKEELDVKLANRVQISKHAVAKVIQTFERLIQRNNKITLALADKAPIINETIQKVNTELQAENQKLHALNTSLHNKHHVMSLKLKVFQDSVNCKETEVAEMRNQIEELKYEYQNIVDRNYKLEIHLGESREKHRELNSVQIDDKVLTKKNKNSTELNLPIQKFEELPNEIEELKELSNNRLQELEMLHQKHKKALMEVEKLKMDQKQVPKNIILETTEYKCLLSRYSVLYNELMLVKNQQLESNGILQISKGFNIRQIRLMESNELIVQEKIRSELMNLKDVNTQLRREYGSLNTQYEQSLAVNKQVGPLNQEMRHLLSSIQSYNTQLKNELLVYKNKYKNQITEIPKLKRELENLQLRLNKQILFSSLNSEEGLLLWEGNEKFKEAQVFMKKDFESEHQLTDSNAEINQKVDLKNVETTNPNQKTFNQNIVMKDLKLQLKKAETDRKEMKLLLDMYKEVSKDQRDKVQLMVVEKKLQIEIEKLKQELKKIQESKVEDLKKLANEDALQKIKQLEEVITKLKNQISTHKQEEQTMITEMELTGQAYEDMQEQNSRLVQQLREKDEANFKLLSERTQSNKLLKLIREEANTYQEMSKVLTQQIDVTKTVVSKLEEKEHILQNALAKLETECLTRQQAMEMYKGKAIESAQSAADLKLHLDKYQVQITEAYQVVAKKTSALEAEAYKTKRLQEEIIQLRRKTEQLKKIKQGRSLDEVMIEEIRQYKETLTCPSCKVRRKDAVITKCFHVFCWDCLRTRYETRQRKCPECNAAFGTNDYHRLYLGS